jgi:membrane-associated HD superfamily phosphohydrolase
MTKSHKSNKKTMKKTTNNNNTNNNSTRVKSCSTNFCDNVFAKKMKIMMDKIKKNIIKKMTAEEKKMYYKHVKNNNHNHNENEKYMLEYQKQMCNDAYCNPTCKDTIFEPGTKIPNAVFEKLKTHLTRQMNKMKSTPKQINKAYKLSNKMLSNTRKNIFGSKKNVLRNGFYEKLPSDKVKLLKKEGAISGCSLAYQFN